MFKTFILFVEDLCKYSPSPGPVHGASTLMLYSNQIKELPQDVYEPLFNTFSKIYLYGKRNVFVPLYISKGIKS